MVFETGISPCESRLEVGPELEPELELGPELKSELEPERNENITGM